MPRKNPPDDPFRGFRLESDADWEQWRGELRAAKSNDDLFRQILRGTNHLRQRDIDIEQHVMLDMIFAMAQRLLSKSPAAE